MKFSKFCCGFPVPAVPVAVPASVPASVPAVPASVPASVPVVPAITGGITGDVTCVNPDGFNIMGLVYDFFISSINLFIILLKVFTFFCVYASFI